jgi:lipid-binding SYLF domain-containing protein
MRLSYICVLLAASAAILPAQDDTPDKRLRSATDTLREIMATPEKGIPRGLLNRARCLVVVPGMKKAAFVVGGQYGRGFALCRSEWGWSAPAPVRMTGGSFGLQLGADSTDIVLLVMNERGMNRLLSDKFSLGADAAVAAGPVGRDATADTDILMRAEILSWSRTHGLFAGASLSGTLVEHDDSEGKRLYGRAMSNHEIISGDIKAPESASGLVGLLNDMSPEKLKGQ